MSSRVHSNYSNSSHRSSIGPSFGRQLRNRCALCIRVFKWLPVLFIVSVLCWGYYAYVIQLSLLNVESVIIKALYLTLFHIIYVLTMWSYWQTIFTDSAHIPRDFWLPTTEREKLVQETNEDNQRRILDHYVSERNLPIQCRAYNGMYRICENCFMIKPDRAHHCSVCDQCVLKMDHHCPWVNNCVSFSNYKFFILFLGYAFLLCLFAAITSFPYFLRFWKNELTEWGKFHILFLFFVSIMFAISLISLFGYHIYLVLLNRSTLESFRAPVFASGPDRNAYNLGKYRNFCQVFGENKMNWFLPIYTSIGDGIIFETQLTRAQLPAEHNSQQSFYNSIGQSNSIAVPIDTQLHSSDNSKGSGLTFEQKNYCDDSYDSDKLLNGDEDREEEAIIARTAASAGPKLTEVPTELSFTTSRSTVDIDINSSQSFIDS